MQSLAPAPRLAPRSVTDLVDATFSLYRQNFVLFAGIVAVLLIPETAVNMVVTASLPAGSTTPAVFSSASQAASQLGPVYAASLGRGLMSAVFSVLILGALSLAISRRFLREPVGVFSAYRDVGIRQFLVLLAALVVLGVVAVVYVTAAILLGVALALNNGGLAIAYGIVAGVGSLILFIFVAVRLVFVAPVVVIERTGVFRAVRRSWWLARGYWWRIVGLTTLVTILVGIIGGILGGFAAVLSLNHPVIATGLSGVLSVLTQPVQYCAITLLYYDQRIRKEGFDLEYAAHESARIAGQWSPPAFS